MENPVLFQNVMRRIQCTFFPWTVRPQGKATTPEHWNSHTSLPFETLEEASVVLLHEVMDVMPDRQAAILDMGCNIGRHLNYLYGQGYRNLTGLDFSSVAIENMANKFPDMYKGSNLVVSSFQDYLTGNPQSVDLVYTRGATFELVHPLFPLVKHVCNIARKYVVMVISETGHAYPRFWAYEFSRHGFELEHLRRPASKKTPEHKVSLLTFRRIAEHR